MLDFSRLTDTLAGILGGSSIAEHAAGNVMDMLHSAGLDPSALTGLSFDEVTQLLSEHGIDPSALTDGQFDQLLAHIGGGDQLAAFASEFLGGGAGTDRG